MDRNISQAFEAFQKYSIDISQQLLLLWETSREPWGVKNIYSQYVYANKAYYELININPASMSIEGYYDDELPCSIARFAWFSKSTIVIPWRFKTGCVRWKFIAMVLSKY
ncbi:hypothetical protein [Sodalis ligni]|uniref:hypothetical protein n=1 Tax=Sodalis ligni TaxID=2697027 RepID=UPI0020978675|nr:hypothetical protein [Sodalis ligni]